MSSWRTLTPGASVKITGVVESVFFAEMTPGDNPDKKYPVAVATIIVRAVGPYRHREN
jgi:hypothetical protein